MISKLNPSDFNVSSTLTQHFESSRDTLGSRTAPVVAVSATSDMLPGFSHRVRLNSAYVNALENAGLIPLIVPPLASVDAARDILSRVDGLVITGGEDVDPSRYGQPRSPLSGEANAARDETEIALIREARESRKPLLAICRGPQVVNVALGGTLIQDIPSEVPGAVGHNAGEERSTRIHDVTIDEGSRIARAIGDTVIRVNSFHHQAVKDTAPGLIVTARAPDGIIECIEPESDDWWMMGVQWHPEEMNDSPEAWDRGIFRAFADRLLEG
jgi:putative glutamine amidotransferase